MATDGSKSTSGAGSDPLGFLADELAELKRSGLYRPLRVVSSAQTVDVVVDGKHLINLSSNNYLGLTTHPRLVEAAIAATREFGAGSGAVRAIAGTMTLHEQLESDRTSDPVYVLSSVVRRLGVPTGLWSGRLGRAMHLGCRWHICPSIAAWYKFHKCFSF